MDGLFVVLEGVDGAGTTTHTKRLVSSLKGSDIPVHLSQEPSGGPLGALLRQALSGRLISKSRVGDGPPAWNTMALLFAADRLDHLDVELLPNLREGVTIVCDRYYHSSVAYQSLTGGGAKVIDWIRELNRYARRPDLTIVLDVPAKVAAERRRERHGSEDIYDDEGLQAQLGDFYARLEQHFPQERVVHVDADGPVEQVADAIRAEVDRVIG